MTDNPTMAVDDVLSGLLADARALTPPAPSKAAQSTQAVELAHELYTLGLDGITKHPFAVRRDGVNVARIIGEKAQGLRGELAAAFYERHGKAIGAGALGDALTVLGGQALAEEPTELVLRTATAGDGIVIDLGDQDGGAVRIGPGGWEILERSPVLFRRTDLLDPLPRPERGGTIDELRQHVNVSDQGWPLLAAWLVASLLPDRPCPVLLLTGEQGTAKTTTARHLVGITDPSPAPVKAAPDNDSDWPIIALANRVIALDNLSYINRQLSDAVCQLVTGGGIVKRKLYSNDETVLLKIKRALILTAIDLSNLRGDLADRIARVELERITPDRRRLEEDVSRDYEAARPRLIGALYDLVAAVLAELPNVNLEAMPRMADFARICAAVDVVLGTDGLASYLNTARDVADDVVESDCVAAAVRGWAEDKGRWRGAPSDLYRLLTPEFDKPRDWPKDSTRFSGRLKRAAPDLRSIGVHVETGRTNATRWVHIDLSEGDAEGDATPAQASPRDAVASPIGHSVTSSVTDLTRESDASDAGDARDPLFPMSYLGEKEANTRDTWSPDDDEADKW